MMLLRVGIGSFGRQLAVKQRLILIGYSVMVPCRMYESRASYKVIMEHTT